MRRLMLACALALGACDDGPAPRAVVGTLTPADLPAFFDCLRETGGTVVSAHRGGPAPGFAENAIPTFENTLAYAPAFLEIDVARTRDGVLVLMHDDTVDRTTDGAGAVRDLTLAAFQALRLQDEAGDTLEANPPTLREALDWASGRAILEIDIKRGVSYEDVAREVENAGAMERVVFITYSVDGASRLARIAPHAMIYTTIRDADDLDLLARRGIDLSRIVAWLGDDALNEGLLAMLTNRGVETRFGLFGRNADYAGAAAAGVHGVAVNDATAALAAIDAADDAEGYAALQCAR